MSKREIVKADAVRSPEITLSILEEVGITPSEIVDLSVSEREQELLIAQKSVETEIEKIEAARDKAGGLLQKEEKKVDASIARKAVRQAKVILRKMEQAGIERLAVSEQVEVKIGADGILATASIQQNHKNGGSDYYSREKIEVDFSYPACDKTEGLRAEIGELDRRHIEARKRLLHIKKDLANITTHERMARGAIVKAKLSQTGKGRALLKELDSIRGSVKALSYSGG